MVTLTFDAEGVTDVLTHIGDTFTVRAYKLDLPLTLIDMENFKKFKIKYNP